MSNKTTCTHILTDKHRLMLGALGIDDVLTMKDVVAREHKAGKGKVSIAQSLCEMVMDRCRDLTLDGAFIVPRDEEGVGKEGYNQVVGFLVTLMAIMKSKHPVALELLDSEDRLKNHRKRPLAMHPIKPGTNRSVVSGRAHLSLKDLGVKNVKALTHASKSSQARVIGEAFDRAQELLADPRVVRKLKKLKTEDVNAKRLTYYDQYEAAINAIRDVILLSGKDASAIMVSLDVTTDRDGRVYFLGALTQQSAKGIQVLTGLPHPTQLLEGLLPKTEVVDEIRKFWKKEFSLDWDDRDGIKAVTDQPIGEWFLSGGCLKVYEHCHCAVASWASGEYYYPIEKDMEQSVGQIAALLRGGIRDLLNVGLIPDSEGVYTSAWQTQDRAMLVNAPNNILSTSDLDFEGRKDVKKGTTTVKSYGAGLATCIIAYSSIPEEYRDTDSIPDDMTLDGFINMLTSSKGRRNCQLILDVARESGIQINTVPELVTSISDLAEDIELSIHTATMATPVINGALCKAAAYAVDNSLSQEWEDCTGFPGRVSTFKVTSDLALPKSKRNRVYATPCFPPLDEEGNIIVAEWCEENRRRQALRLLPMADNMSPMSLAPCFFQGAVESAIVRMVYRIASRLLPDAYLSSRHDCEIMGAEHAALIEKIFVHVTYRVALLTNVSEMFPHLEVPSEVPVTHWDNSGNVVTTWMATQDPNRLANLQQVKGSMKPFGV